MVLPDVRQTIIEILLEQLDAKCERVSVTELRDNTFYASITVSVNGSELEIDSRPSDAIALAVRTSAPIFAADDVIDNSGALADLEPQVERLHQLNGAYYARHGFPFIIAVRDNTKDSILAAFRTRIGNDTPTEFTTACAQVERIAELRLKDQLP